MNKPTEQEAYELLNQLTISYKKINHAPITSVINCPFDLPGPQVKNLLLKTKKGQEYFLVILPDEKLANLKDLASKLNTNRLSFASPEELDSLIGLPPGSVTPLAIHHDIFNKIQVVIDSDIDQENTVGFHPNINTATLIISFHDLERFLKWAKHVPIYVKL